MKIKLLEIRDRSTFMRCFAFKPNEAHTADPMVKIYAHKNKEAAVRCVESHLVGRTGYGGDCRSIVFGSLNDPSRCQNDPFAWDGGARTLHVAHDYIENNWDEIESGDVIDVEFILKESTTKKTSEAFNP